MYNRRDSKGGRSQFCYGACAGVAEGKDRDQNGELVKEVSVSLIISGQELFIRGIVPIEYGQKRHV